MDRFKFIAAFRRSAQSLDERVDEWIELLKEDAPLYPRDRRPVAAMSTQRGGRHRQVSATFMSLNGTRSK